MHLARFQSLLTRAFAAPVLSLVMACAGPAHAQDKSKAPTDDKGSESKKDGDGKKDEAVEIVAVTKGKAKIGGATIPYTASAGTIHLKDDADKATASVFYIAYTKDQTTDKSTRPITYVFNGGPGSSSVWLHLGTFGPRRVAFEDALLPAPPPYDLVDNQHSLLDLTDLVFIDPVGTGFSKALGEHKNSEFWGVDADVDAVGDFIRVYTTRNARWNSPKFLAGESYGTTRASALANHLQNQGMFFNGVILVSSVLNFQTITFSPANDLGYILYLPSYAATAWYHRRLPQPMRDLPAFLAEVRTFAQTEYAQALMDGARLTPEKRATIVDRLHRYTGLDKAFLEQANLRISQSRFCKELTRANGTIVGRLDARYVGTDADSAGEHSYVDPSYTAILGPYTAGMQHYLKTELKIDNEAPYNILNGEVNRGWNWQRGQSRDQTVNVSEDLAEAMRDNPHLQIFVANGYYDLATPFFATEYTFEHLRVPNSARSNVSMGYYPSGHMMYQHEPSLAQLKRDIAGLFARTAKSRRR